MHIGMYLEMDFFSVAFLYISPICSSPTGWFLEVLILIDKIFIYYHEQYKFCAQRLSYVT